MSTRAPAAVGRGQPLYYTHSGRFLNRVFRKSNLDSTFRFNFRKIGFLNVLAPERRILDPRAPTQDVVKRETREAKKTGYPRSSWQRRHGAGIESRIQIRLTQGLQTPPKGGSKTLFQRKSNLKVEFRFGFRKSRGFKNRPYSFAPSLQEII